MFYCIFGRADLIPVEIKAGKTVAIDFFKAFDGWQELIQLSKKEQYVIYGGIENQNLLQAIVLGWKSAANLIKMIK
jgi:hypothetical protein